MKKLCCAVLLCALLFTLSACGRESAYLSEGSFMKTLSGLTADSFGELKGVSLGQDPDGYTVTEYRINDTLVLDNFVKPTTQEIVKTELILNDPLDEEKNTQFFCCFLLYVLKSHDTSLSVESMNQIYDGLSATDLTTAGTREVAYKATEFSLTVGEDGKVTFSAVYYTERDL